MKSLRAITKISGHEQFSILSLHVLNDILDIFLGYMVNSCYI